MQFVSYDNRRIQEVIVLEGRLPILWTANSPDDHVSKHSRTSKHDKECWTGDLKEVPEVTSSDDDDSCRSGESLPVSHPANGDTSALHWFLLDLLGDKASQCTIVDDQWTNRTKSQTAVSVHRVVSPSVTVDYPVEEMPRLLTFSQEVAAFI